MRSLVLLLISGCAIALILGQCRFSGEHRTEALYAHYCGSCHLPPDPSVLTKALWQQQVLPEMGARLGIKVGDYDPLKGLDLEEAYHVELSRTYPGEPLLAAADWQLIYDYVLRLAPDTLPADASRAGRSEPLRQFSVHPLALDNLPGAYITALEYDEGQQRWQIGNRAGEWYEWYGVDSSKLMYLFGSAVAGFDLSDSAQMVVEMGYMNPSDVPRGRLWQFIEGKPSVIAENLYRPVFVKSLDAAPNGQPGYVVCEFGNRAGRLSLFQQTGRQAQGNALLSVPGTIRALPADMNKDGREDLVVLAGQGDEGIYLLQNEGNGKASITHPIRLPPIYGSSWFELFDYEGDGDLDVAIVCGDNADYTYALKPYHGLRLFLNDGRNAFTEALFYPIYGATRLIARDFDQDGDIDFFVTALFADLVHHPDESFVYLENRDAASFLLRSFTSPAATAGQWLVMDAGDVEGDGDLDILLGSYTSSPAPVPDSLRRKWTRQNVDLLLLENQASSSVGNDQEGRSLIRK